ncbi:hypothetical protein ECG_09658 [Echinococcus granulosus]|uniref:Conserved plasma membrane protein n=1 Tax=Echinococcus granulosus TaxID=6210 RepID=A0A068WS30_ECHGR|nr:hypothetical protein ECG_09658 [Echinococcus granulosus]CDS20479.1 hypothetical protein EgrG_001115400 [Echinococcus granulosus]
MGLQFSLIATVAAVMTWVIRTENGGLLNVLFRIVATPLGQDPQFSLISKLDEPVVGYFKNMLLFKPVPLPILQAMPESLGGGQAGVDSAHANPNRGPNIFWITVATFLLAIVLIVLIQVINSCCCCYKKKGHHGSMNALQMAALRSDFRNKQLIFRIVYTVLLILALVFLAVSIILLIVYFSSAGLVVSYLETNPQPPTNHTPISLPDGLRATISHASSFVSNGIANGRTLTKRVLNEFIQQTDDKIYAEVLDAIERLLGYLGVRNALKKGEKTVEAMKTFSSYVNSVYGDIASLHNATVSLDKELTDVRVSYAEAFGKVSNCNAWEECQKLNATVAKFKSPVSLNAVNTTVIKTFGEGLNRTIGNLSRPLEEVRETITKLQNSTKEILDTLKTQLNLAQILDQIEPFWNDAQSQSEKLLKELNDMIRSVETQVPKYVKYIRIGFYVVGGVFAAMMVIATLIATRLVYRAVRDRLFADPNTVSIGSTNSKWDNVVCSKSSVCCCSVLFIPILLMFAAIIAVLLFALTTISSEGCMYVVRESAVNKSDFVVNSLVAEQWKSLIGDAVGGTADFLNTSPPRNILLALTRTCNRESSEHVVGLLSAVGYQSLISVSKLVNRPEVIQGIQQGREAVLKQIGSLNISGNLPSEAEIEEIQKKLNETITNLTLNELINTTNPDYMNTSSFEILLKKMEQFAALSNITNATFEKPNAALSRAIETMVGIKSQMANTRKSLQTLNAQKPNILGPLHEAINSLKLSRDAAESAKLTKEVGVQYDRLAKNLADYMKVDGGRRFEGLTASLFPCAEAHAAYSAAMGVTCGEAGGVSLLLGLSYVLALNVLFLTFLYFALFNLAFFQALQVHMLSDISGEE